MRTYATTTTKDDYGWLQEDPIEEAGGGNLYNFCNGNPLRSYDLWGQATVYIWGIKLNGGVGHSAMKLKDGTYISFWPKGGASASHPRKEAYNNIYEDDGKKERRGPDWVLEYEKLNETLVSSWYTQYLYSKPYYDLSSNNCSHIVYEAFRRGGAKTYEEVRSTQKWMGPVDLFASSIISDWFPEKVRLYIALLKRDEEENCK